MPLNIGKIELHVGPQQLGGPDNLRQAIVGFIDGAQKSLDIAVQELDNWEIAKAVIRAKLRKVRVRLVLEADYLIESRIISRQPKQREDCFQKAVIKRGLRRIRRSALRARSFSSA